MPIAIKPTATAIGTRDLFVNTVPIKRTVVVVCIELVPTKIMRNCWHPAGLAEHAAARLEQRVWKLVPVQYSSSSLPLD